MPRDLPSVLPAGSGSRTPELCSYQSKIRCLLLFALFLFLKLHSVFSICLKQGLINRPGQPETWAEQGCPLALDPPASNSHVFLSQSRGTKLGSLLRLVADRGDWGSLLQVKHRGARLHQQHLGEGGRWEMLDTDHVRLNGCLIAGPVSEGAGLGWLPALWLGRQPCLCVSSHMVQSRAWARKKMLGLNQSLSWL